MKSIDIKKLMQALTGKLSYERVAVYSFRFLLFLGIAAFAVDILVFYLYAYKAVSSGAQPSGRGLIRFRQSELQEITETIEKRKKEYNEALKK